MSWCKKLQKKCIFQLFAWKGHKIYWWVKSWRVKLFSRYSTKDDLLYNSPHDQKPTECIFLWPRLIKGGRFWDWISLTYQTWHGWILCRTRLLADSRGPLHSFLALFFLSNSFSFLELYCTMTTHLTFLIFFSVSCFHDSVKLLRDWPLFYGWVCLPTASHAFTVLVLQIAVEHSLLSNVWKQFFHIHCHLFIWLRLVSPIAISTSWPKAKANIIFILWYNSNK